VSAWRRAAALSGAIGAVLFLFGALTYGLTRRFDAWTAIHFTGGGILLAIGVAANVPAVRRSAGSRAGRHRLRSAAGIALMAAIAILSVSVLDDLDLRWDATAERIHTWSERAAAEFADIRGNLRVTAFWDPTLPDAEGVRDLIARVDGVGGGVDARCVDPAERPETAAALGVERAGTVVVEADGRTVRATFEPGEFGEAELLALVRRATAEGPRTIAWAAGTGGPSIADGASPAGGAYLREVWSDLALEVREVDLASDAGVPSETAFLALVGPSRALSDRELAALAGWLDGGGRALFMVEPGIDPRLAERLAERGAILGSDVVLDPDRAPARGARSGVDVLSDVPPADPACARAVDPVLLRVAQSVDAAPGSGARIILASGPEAWAESDVEALVRDGRMSRDPGDRPGPVPLAVAVESGTLRMVVIGDADVARNARLGAFGNRAWIEAVSRWLAGDPPADETPPRRLRASRLDLDEAGLRSLFRFSVVLLPEAILVVGLALWWWRRAR